jgi:hypothetical protein
MSPTGLISGTPNTSGSFTFTVEATDSCPAGAQSVQKSFSVEAGTTSVSGTTTTPSSLNIPSGTATTQNLLYGLSSVPPVDLTLQSAQGVFLVGGTIIDTVNVPLTVSIINGSGSTSELLNVSASLTKKAESLGATNITYERTFTDGTFSVLTQVDMTITTEAAAELRVTRIQLYFDNRRAETTVKRGTPNLKAFADIRYTGTGILEGFWEVDRRLLANVKQIITFGTSITLETPPVPPIPTFEAGTHRIRFVIAKQGDISFPEAIYFVTEERFELKAARVMLQSPLNNSSLSFEPLTFRWKARDGAIVYLIEFLERGGEKPIFSAYRKKETSYSLPPPVLKRIFSPGKDYFWRVKAFDRGNNIAGESQLFRFRFR